MQKAILLSLDDTYEEELISSTGKHKEDTSVKLVILFISKTFVY